MSTIIGNPIILPSGGGTLPSLLITTETGATVTATLGSQIVTLIEIDQGQYYTELPDYGTWTVTAALNNEVSSKTIDVTAVELYQVKVSFIPEDVNDATWAQISEVSQAGIGDTYWDIGDTKAITLNGTVGTKSYSNVTLYLFILHFNMPVNKTVADNNIIWGGFKTAKSGGIDICLDGVNYGNESQAGEKVFNMNHTSAPIGSTSPVGYYGTNYGGWKGTDLRYDILGTTDTQPGQYNQRKDTLNVGFDATQTAIASPLNNTLMAALPSDFRNTLRLWTRWMDSKGNKSNVDANVTSCVDAGISLLTEFEVSGACFQANQYEQNHQVQCSYYVAGNSKGKYKQSSPSSAATWWGSSAAMASIASFCVIDISPQAASTSADYVGGLAPAFKT